MKKRAIKEMKRSMKKRAEFTMVFEALYGEIITRHEEYQKLKEVTGCAKQEIEDFYEGVSMIMQDLYPFAMEMRDTLYESILLGKMEVSVDKLFAVFEKMIFDCIARSKLFPSEMGRTITQIGLILNFAIKPILSRGKLCESVEQDIVVAFWELMHSLKFCLEENGSGDVR